MPKHIGYAPILFILTASLLAGAIHAKAADKCSFSEGLKALADLQANPNPDYLTQLQNEVKLRRSILKNICDCGLTDTQNLEASLKKASVSDPDIADIRDQLLGQISEIKSHYLSERGRIDDLGLYGTKEFARNLEDWRAANQNQTINRATNFVLWANNQTLLGTASARFQKISQTVQGLGLGDKDDIKDFFHKASSALRDARAQNNAAADLFRKNENPPLVLDTVKASLASLADAYQTFFDLSATIQKFLPQ